MMAKAALAGSRAWKKLQPSHFPHCVLGNVRSNSFRQIEDSLGNDIFSPVDARSCWHLFLEGTSWRSIAGTNKQRP